MTIFRAKKPAENDSDGEEEKKYLTPEKISPFPC